MVAKQPSRKPLALQFEPAQLSDLARRYDYGTARQRALETRIVDRIAPAVRARGHFSRSELRTVCYWKTPRSKPLVDRNQARDVEEATHLALHAKSEALRIDILRALHGVEWATASVLLHFGHPEPYPIIDYRALEAVGVPRGSVQYTLDLWLEYVDLCRTLAAAQRVDMRTVDRALWQWSNERPPT